MITIFKDGVRSSFTNYRPISLISAFGKFVEKFVCKQLVRYLNRFNLLYSNQFGFRAGYDTTLPLLHFTNKVKPALDISKQIYNISIFIDLKKAFHTVPFNLLLEKLDYYGVRETELRWFSSYLCNRVQAVDIQGKLSKKLTTKMGVPQGSVLGPVLFLIYINDFHKALDHDVTTILFADDTTLQLISGNLPHLYLKANSNLRKAEEWFNINLLTINSSKTKYILFYNQNHHIHFDNLIFGGQIIERIGEDCPTKYFKFLGNLIDDTLTWSYHISSIIKKLNSANYALAQTKNYLPLFARKLIYESLAKSHLTFSCNIYGASKINLINKLEKVQKKLIRNLAGKKYNCHTGPILKELNLTLVSEIIKTNQILFIKN